MRVGIDLRFVSKNRNVKRFSEITKKIKRSLTIMFNGFFILLSGEIDF